MIATVNWQPIAILAAAALLLLILAKPIARLLGKIVGAILSVFGLPLWLVTKARESRSLPWIIIFGVLLTGAAIMFLRF